MAGAEGKSSKEAAAIPATLRVEVTAGQATTEYSPNAQGGVRISITIMIIIRHLLRVAIDRNDRSCKRTPAIRRPTSNVRPNRCRLNHASVANNAMACSSNAFPCFPLSFAGYLVLSVASLVNLSSE